LSSRYLYSLHFTSSKAFAKATIVTVLLISAASFTGYHFFGDVINYTEYEPIVIEGNEQFHSYAHSYKWDGDGTESNPYKLDKIKTRIIEISSTSLYFSITNSHLTGHYTRKFNGYVGIFLGSVTNGEISNNILSYNQVTNENAGICIASSSNIKVRDNVITGFNSGIYSISSNGVQLQNNAFHGNNHGVYITQGNLFTIKQNSFLGNGNGLYIISSNAIRNIDDNEFLGDGNSIFIQSSSGVTLRSNTISGSGNGLAIISSTYIQLYSNHISGSGNAIVLISSNNINLERNTIEESGSGLVLTDADQNTVKYNTFTDVEAYAINLDKDSVSNTIKWNNFISNNDGGSSQALDVGYDNEFSENYWSRWLTPDADSNGIVDNSYRIDGGSNRDYFPLTTENSDKLLGNWL
jgi:parallel beta-helix repeat protein